MDVDGAHSAWRTPADRRVLSGTQPHQRATRSIRSLLILMLLVNLSSSLYQLPVNRVIERRLCREYYGEHDPAKVGLDGSVEEKLCKVDVIQRDLAWMQGVMETVWIFGDFVMTIPLSFLADKYGSRRLFLLNLIPRVVMLGWVVVAGSFDRTLPTKAILLAPFLSVLGGDCFFSALAYSLAAGATDDPATRASYFGYMSSVSYVVALLGPALASATMSLLLWLPFFIGIFLLLLAAPVISNLPGRHASDQADPESESQALLSSPQLKATRPGESMFNSVSDRFQKLHAIVQAHPRNFSLLLVSFVFTSLASSDTKLLPQYISKRYGWLFASAGYLLSVKAVVNFVLLAVVIPWLLRRRQPVSPGDTLTTRTNLHYANMCLAVSIIGALAIAIASTTWILVPALLLYALGSALPVFTLSLLKSPAVAPPDESSGTEMQIFSIVMLVKTSGSLLGAPLMAGLWSTGIARGGVALGFPYFVSSACYVAAMLVLSGIKAS